MVSEIWVINASPLILLNKLRRLDFLKSLASTLIVPQAVFSEVQAGTSKDPMANDALN
jgi:predicted nucleic acid-binding protein